MKPSPTLGKTFGFLYSGGVYNTLSYPGSTFTIAYDINNNSQILGIHYLAGTAGLFLFQNGVYTPLTIPTITDLTAFKSYGINDGGDIVGQYDGSGSFIYNLISGTFSTIPPYDGGPDFHLTGFSVADINDSGEIVGNVSGFTSPLPSALPLFATGLGALGLLGWRRKRKNVAAIAA